MKALAEHSSSWWRAICSTNIGNSENSVEYSIKETYKVLRVEDMTETSSMWPTIWHKSVPTKVSCLVRRLLHKRLPTKDNLLRRGVLGPKNTSCVSGCGQEESTSHLFFVCPLFAGVWTLIIRWLRIPAVLPIEGWEHFEQFGFLAAGGKIEEIRIRVVWFACIWCIWKARNNSIFKNKETSAEKVFEEVQRVA